MIRERQEDLRSRGGAVTPELMDETEADGGVAGGKGTEEVSVDYEVTANSALSEYLAGQYDEWEAADQSARFSGKRGYILSP